MNKFVVYSFLLLAAVCIFGVQSTTYSLAVNEVPIYDICANGGDALSCSNHGSCVNGACLCSGDYSGRDCSIPPNGGFHYSNFNPLPAARATKFANLDGSDGQLQMTTCFGNFPNGGWVNKNYLPNGVTGIAAVNPTLYGSRFAFGGPGQYTPKTVTGSYSGVGQSCGQCFNLTKGANHAVVMVVNRCGGFCQANSASGPCAINGTTSTDCGYCVTPTTTPTTIDCSCMSDIAIQTNGYCDSTGTAHHCDHCAQNDHPHFDLDTDTLNYLCGDANAGVCNLDSFQWVQCDGIQAQPGDYPNGGPTPTVLPSNAVASGGSAPAAPAPTVRVTAAPTQRPTAAPTQRPTPAPTQRPPARPTPAPTQPATKRPTAAPTQSGAGVSAVNPNGATTCSAAENGNMRCAGASSYQTCDHGIWQAAQNCAAGLVCSPAGQFIYCVL